MRRMEIIGFWNRDAPKHVHFLSTFLSTYPAQNPFQSHIKKKGGSFEPPDFIYVTGRGERI
jgi:hypothetical protein